MKRFYIIMLILMLLINLNCKNKNKEYHNLKNSQKDIIINKLDIDSLLLEKINSSYLGFTRIIDNKIYFIDKRFCWVYVFNKEGKFLNRYLGQGNGPKEINIGIIYGYANLRDKSHFFIGAVENCCIYDKDFNKKRMFFINTLSERSKLGDEVIIKEPSPEKALFYSTPINMIIRDYDKFIYYTISMEHPKLNFVQHHKKYYKICHVIAKMNLSNGKIDNLLGNYPEIYIKDPRLKQFSLLNFDIDKKGNFYLSFEADSMIYLYDKNFKLKRIFGFKGREMDENYMNLKTIEEFKKYAYKQREECGYYMWLEYIDEKDILFRSYQKGKNSRTDGLQIYKNNILIGDIDVPKGLRVDGYIPPYIYSHGVIDEEKEMIKIYRFKIDF